MRLESAIRTPIALEVAADEGHISKAPGNKRIDGAIVGSGSRVYKETAHKICTEFQIGNCDSYTASGPRALLQGCGRTGRESIYQRCIVIAITPFVSRRENQDRFVSATCDMANMQVHFRWYSYWRLSARRVPRRLPRQIFVKRRLNTPLGAGGFVSRKGRAVHFCVRYFPCLVGFQR